MRASEPDHPVSLFHGLLFWGLEISPTGKRVAYPGGHSHGHQLERLYRDTHSHANFHFDGYRHQDADLHTHFHSHIHLLDNTLCHPHIDGFNDP